MERAGTLTLGGSQDAKTVRVDAFAELPDALAALGLQPTRPTVVLVGGAGGLSDDDLVRLRPLFADGLVPTMEKLGACVMDGGTDVGVMRLLGEARAAAGASFPLVGVPAVGTVSLPGADADGLAQLEPNHTHFLFVPGTSWGDETAWLARTAGAASRGHPSVTVLVNGGDVALSDVEESVAAGRRVLVVAGSGRAADALAAALRGEPADERARTLAESGLLTAADPAFLAAQLETLLAPARASALPADGASTLPADGSVEVEALIEALDDLTPTQRQLLKARWAAQVRWTAAAAKRAQRRYYRLRVLMVVGAVVVPALVGLNVRGGFATGLLWVTFALGLVLGCATAIDQFFDFGERWRHYRRTSERLKAEGWLYLALAGEYESASNHSAAFPRFSARVEDLLREDVDSFVTLVTPQQQQPS
jgi:hypothetical protein